MGSVLLKLNLISEKKLVAFLARQFRMPVMDLSKIRIAEETLNTLPKPLIQKNFVLPLFTSEENGKDILAVAMANPGDLVALDEIHFTSRMEARPIIVSDPQLTRAIDYYCHGNGLEPGDSSAKLSTEFTFGDVVQITKEYLSANKVADEEKEKNLGPKDGEFLIGKAALDDVQATTPEDEEVLVFTGNSEQHISLDDGYYEPGSSSVENEAHQTSETKAVDDVNTERVLRALIEALESKGVLTKADIKKFIKS